MNPDDISHAQLDGRGLPPAGSTAEWECGSIDQLRQLGEELRGLFAHERRAIAALDHAALTWLAEQKRHVVDQLAIAKAAAPAQLPRELRDLFAAIQAEARASAMLANTAAQAVRALLGYEAPNGYDRKARQTAHRPHRVLMTY